MIKEKRIPTILALIILVGGVIATVSLSQRNSNPVTKASGDCEPKNPQVTNITNSSVSIFFVTESSCLSSLQINDQIIKNAVVFSDDQKSQIHYFDITNLDDSTDYDYSVINDGKSYKLSSFKFKTAQKPSSPLPSSNLAWGRVFTPELKSAAKVILFLNIPGSSPLSALITSSGNWNISLANSFNESKNDYFTMPTNSPEEIIVIDQNRQATQISAYTSQNNPAPDIILGQNQFSPTNVIYDSTTDTGYLPSIDPVNNTKNLDILNPKDNESLSTQKPDFFGTGPGTSKIKIEVHSDTVYTGEVTSSTDGSWNWSPPADLTPGEHTITISTIENGIEKIVSRNFTVLASDNLLAYSSTPSASTPTPTPTPTTVPTTTTTPLPTSTPTRVPTPTIAPTSTPRVTSPSTSSGIPKTGYPLPTSLLLLLATSFVTFSILILKKNR